MIKFVMTNKKQSTKGDNTLKKITATEKKRKQFEEIIRRSGETAIEE